MYITVRKSHKRFPLTLSNFINFVSQTRSNIISSSNLLSFYLITLRKSQKSSTGPVLPTSDRTCGTVTLSLTSSLCRYSLQILPLGCPEPWTKSHL